MQVGCVCMMLSVAMYGLVFATLTAPILESVDAMGYVSLFTVFGVAYNVCTVADPTEPRAHPKRCERHARHRGGRDARRLFARSPRHPPKDGGEAGLGRPRRNAKCLPASR